MQGSDVMSAVTCPYPERMLTSSPCSAPPWWSSCSCWLGVSPSSAWRKYPHCVWHLALPLVLTQAKGQEMGVLFALDIDKALHGDKFWCLVVCGRYVWTVTLRGPAVHGGCRIVQPQPRPSISASELCFSWTEKIPPTQKKMVKETEKTRLVEILPVLGYKHIPALWQCPRLAASSCYLIMIYCI